MVENAATVADCAITRTPDAGTSDTDVVGRMRVEREQLTHMLRAVAAELDDLDRRLSDIVWRLKARLARGADRGVDREQAVLTIQRDRLTGRLQGLAARLKDIDDALSGAAAQSRWPSVHVGTCPDCGYPSLGSGLCASCRLYLAR